MLQIFVDLCIGKETQKMAATWQRRIEISKIFVVMVVFPQLCTPPGLLRLSFSSPDEKNLAVSLVKFSFIASFLTD